METNHALEQAKAQMQGIVEMVAALECDYERRNYEERSGHGIKSKADR